MMTSNLGKKAQPNDKLKDTSQKMKSIDLRKTAITVLLICIPFVSLAGPEDEKAAEPKQSAIEVIMALALGSTNQSPP
ncbi:MAG: hypothetical protein ACI8WB_002331 [Phenylobacterium sp.]|jgi:hypothetical protein